VNTQTANYLDAIGHLPAGGALILNDVSWEDFEQLLSDLGDSYAVRISYDRGRLEIMSSSSIHEMYKDLLLRLACLLAEELDLILESRGSTTFKQKEFARAIEPDTCFYVQNASRIIGRSRIDLSVDPPPDIVVEIDVSHESTTKHAIYAGMRVPELWCYDEREAHIYHLMDEGYVEMSASRALPVITSEVLTRFLAQSKTEGQSATLRSFREWLHAQRL